MTATRKVQAYYSALGRLRMLGGHPALDLANTTHWRDGKIIDFIPDYESLVNWSVAAKLLTQHEAQILLGHSKAHGAVGNSILLRWLHMRDLFRTHLALMTADQVSNSARNKDVGFARLGHELTMLLGEAGFSGLAGEFSGPDSVAMDLPLLRSVNAVMTLLMFTPQAQIRACDGDRCGGYFLNTSRSKPRRWCAMDACGNRAKVHRHREMLVHVSGGSGESP